MRLLEVLAILALTGTMLAGCLANDDAPTDATVEPVETPTVDVPAEVAELRDAIHTAVGTGEPVSLPAFAVYELGGTDPRAQESEFSVVLERSGLVDNATWAEIDGERVELPHVETYAGHVEGDEDQLVRLTLAETWARGSIRTDDLAHLVRVGMDGNLPPGAFQGDAVRAQTPELPQAYDPPDWQEHECISLVPGHAIKPVIELGRSAESELLTQIVLDGDAQYMDALGDDAFPMMVAFLNEVDAIFDHETGIRFHIVGVHAHTDEEFYPDPAQEAPLATAARYWNARDVDRDIVHIFTGQESSFAQANCIGGAGMPEESYTFTPLGWARDYTVFHTNAFAHELGHIFNAHHHYGNHAESELATIMIQGYTPGSNPVFSTLSKSHIRGWAEEYVG